MKTFIKICGLTNIEDARVAVEAGADLLGFILYPKSPRYVAPLQIAEIISTIEQVQAQVPNQKRVKTVGVFVNESEEHICHILESTGLDLVQLHGDESPAMHQSMLRAYPQRAYKALRPADEIEANEQAEQYADSGSDSSPTALPDRPSWLLDAYEAGLYGGTGKRADWDSAAKLAKAYPGLLLAGGLRAENVAKAIQHVQPWGVDVASGVEREPGRKDHQAIWDFIAAATNFLDSRP